MLYPVLDLTIDKVVGLQNVIPLIPDAPMDSAIVRPYV